jgi:ATPase subunit of ABC transporter with duplicated ATPase domains
LQEELITTYKEDYDAFEQTRDKRLQNQQKAHEVKQAKIHREDQTKQDPTGSNTIKHDERGLNKVESNLD